MQLNRTDSDYEVRDQKLASLDPSQRAVIESSCNRLYVVAPAGYGKTTTMVAKVRHDLSEGWIPNPKRALCLTFSVNAARKMRNDLRASLPRYCSDRFIACNFHSLARRILSLYGGNSFGALGRGALVPINDGEAASIVEGLGDIGRAHSGIFLAFENSVRVGLETDIRGLMDEYCEAVVTRLIPLGKITYNGELALAVKCLSDNPEVGRYFQSAYPYIVIDEAQDTNALAYMLLKSIIGKTSALCLFGDPYQRVYGFMGALPDFERRLGEELGIKRLSLNENHRFDNNSHMSLLDRNVRAAIENPFDPAAIGEAVIPFDVCRSAREEANRATEIAMRIVEANPDVRVAILLRGRGGFSDTLTASLREASADYFDALFLDDAEEYVRFNQACLTMLWRHVEKRGKMSSTELDSLFEDMAEQHSVNEMTHGDSYATLLLALRELMKDEMPTADDESRVGYLRGVFEERSLRHALSHVRSRIIVTTMHASKGLEWDYVVIPEMNYRTEPSWRLCTNCENAGGNLVVKERNRCILSGKWASEALVDELKVFYVALTRARKQVICLSSVEPSVDRYSRSHPVYISCFLSLPGIRLARSRDVLGF